MSASWPVLPISFCSCQGRFRSSRNANSERYLIGAGFVNGADRLLSGVLQAPPSSFQDHGRVDLTLESQLAESRHPFRQLYAAGVDYEDVVATLGREDIEKFVASFDQLLKGDRR